MNKQKKLMLANLLLEKQKREEIKDLANINNAYEWITKNSFVNENGAKMEFVDRSFLIEPLCDESPILAVIKCSQIGFSTISIFKTAFHNIKYGHNVIYTLPTDSDSNEFSKAKTNLIIESNQGIKQNLIDNSLHTKSFRTLDGSNVGFWFSKGTYGQSAAIMQTADILIKDEFDRSNPGVLNQYKSRIKASAYKREWEFSNPSFPMFGVDATYELSDQKHYFFKCKCGHWSYITYEQESFDRGNTHHVCKERKEYVCGSCNEILDRKNAKKQWVKKWTDIEDISGYWISQMMAPWISARELIRDEKLMLPDVFANFNLGRPYASDSNALDPSNIIKNIVYDENGYVPKVTPGKYRVMGIDQGGTIDQPKFYCVVGTEEGINRIIKLEGEETLHNFIRMNNIDIVTIDNMPYPEIAVRLVNAFPGRIYRCYFDYKDERKNIYDVDYKTRMVHVHRTRIFDYVVDSYITSSRKVYIDGSEPSLSDMKGESLVKHWMAQRKVGGQGEKPEDRAKNKHIKLDREGNVRALWVNEGHDHFSLADVYCAVSQILAKRQVGPEYDVSQGVFG